MSIIKAGDVVVIDGVSYKRHDMHFSMLVAPNGDVVTRSGLDRAKLTARYTREHEERLASQALKKKALV